jgi:BirA family biotin operon repressor/biotin-[acetyl-CoA-carboxylase] ligase
VILADAPLVLFDEIDSTNLEARRRAESGHPDPAWLMARRQSAGRGRRGRAWASPQGNLYLTYLGASARPLGDIALFGFVAAVALADTVDAFLGAARARLKWPNDVMIDGAKCAGILPESGALSDQRHWFCIGMGVNLASKPEGLAYRVSCLAEFGAAPAVDAFAADLRTRLQDWSWRFETDGFAPIRAHWLARAHGLGETVTAQIGETRISGECIDMGDDGALILRLANGAVQRISAGEVSFG